MIVRATMMAFPSNVCKGVSLSPFIPNLHFFVVSRRKSASHQQPQRVQSSDSCRVTLGNTPSLVQSDDLVRQPILPLVHKQDGLYQVNVTTVFDVRFLSTDWLIQHSASAETHPHHLHRHSRFPVKTQQTISHGKASTFSNNFQLFPCLDVDLSTCFNTPGHISHSRPSGLITTRLQYCGKAYTCTPFLKLLFHIGSHLALLLVAPYWPTQSWLTTLFYLADRLFYHLPQDRSTPSTTRPVASSVTQYPPSVRLANIQKSHLAKGYTRRVAKSISFVNQIPIIP